MLHNMVYPPSATGNDQQLTSIYRQNSKEYTDK